MRPGSRCCSSATRVGQVMLGYETTVRVTMAEMVHHTKAVVRGTARALVVADMPFLSYATPDEAIENAGIFLREAGAQAVKVEGGVRTRAGHRDARPGRHPGHGPHRADAAGDQRGRQGPGPGQDPRPGPGAHRRRARRPGGRRLRDGPGARPGAARRGRSRSASASRRSASAPGAGCSGQVQIITDLIGLGDFIPTHARPYAHVARADPRRRRRLCRRRRRPGTFPGRGETVRMDDAVLDEVLGRGPPDRATRLDPGRRHPARPRPLIPSPTRP